MTMCAIKNLNLDIKREQRVAFLGQNGSGKPMTIKLLIGILKPTSSEIECPSLNAFYQRKKYVSKHRGSLWQKPQLWWDLPVRDSFELLMLIYKILVPLIKKNIALFGDVIQINSRLDKPAQILSLGQRVKYDIAASVVHSPEIFFLDEPTISLDIKLNPLSTIWFAS